MTHSAYPAVSGGRLETPFQVRGLFPDLPDRVMTVRAIWSGDPGVGIEYQVTPPLPDHYFPVRWWMLGRDDLGNEYHDAGGGFRNSCDGPCTEGDRWVQRLSECESDRKPPARAERLQLTFYCEGDQAEPERVVGVVRVRLPIPAFRARGRPW